jgi:hypothetical protein
MFDVHADSPGGGRSFLAPHCAALVDDPTNMIARARGGQDISIDF